MQTTQSRRSFLATLSSVGAAGFIGAPDALAAEAPPETTAVRIAKIAGICIAPQYVADELLRMEGFRRLAGFRPPYRSRAAKSISPRTLRQP